MYLKSKAISVNQPYANLIRDGLKTLEIREWKTEHRGPLVICSTRKILMARDTIAAQFHPNYQPHDGYAHGEIICMVDLTGIAPFEPEDAAKACAEYPAGAWAWKLENPRVLSYDHTYPIRGLPGLFTVELVTEKVRDSGSIKSELVDIQTY